MRVRTCKWARVLCSVTLMLSADGTMAGSAEVANMQHKLLRIRNYSNAGGQPQTTVMTEAEINSYMNSAEISLPQGVQSVTLKGQAGLVTGNTRVDFDKLKTGRNSSNPLLSIFSGLHDVEVEAHVEGLKRLGRVQVDSVSLDGVEVPRFILELFVDKYVTPKYPGIGLDSSFPLPNRIDRAEVGNHILTLVQK